MSKDIMESGEDTLKIIGEKSDRTLEAEAESKAFLNYLEKDYPDIGTIRIYHSSLDIDSEVEDVYTKNFNRLLMESDLMTEKRLERLLEEKQAWTEEDEDEIENTINSINNLQLDSAEIRRTVKIRKGNKTNKAELKRFEEINEKILSLNTKLLTLTIKKSRLFEGTIEKRAERQAILHKLIRCVTNLDGTPVWENESDVGQAKGIIIKRVAADALRFWSGVDSPLSEGLLDQISGI